MEHPLLYCSGIQHKDTHKAATLMYFNWVDTWQNRFREEIVERNWKTGWRGVEIEVTYSYYNAKWNNETAINPMESVWCIKFFNLFVFTRMILITLKILQGEFSLKKKTYNAEISMMVSWYHGINDVVWKN